MKQLRSNLVHDGIRRFISAVAAIGTASRCSLLLALTLHGAPPPKPPAPGPPTQATSRNRRYEFNKTMAREVLENYNEESIRAIWAADPVRP